MFNSLSSSVSVSGDFRIRVTLPSGRAFFVFQVISRTTNTTLEVSFGKRAMCLRLNRSSYTSTRSCLMFLYFLQIMKSEIRIVGAVPHNGIMRLEARYVQTKT